MERVIGAPAHVIGVMILDIRQAAVVGVLE